VVYEAAEGATMDKITNISGVAEESEIENNRGSSDQDREN